MRATATATGFEWDYDELDARLGSMSGRSGAARLWILCHPHNPTGRVFGRLELESIATLAAKHDLVVVSDEIHAELVHAGHRSRAVRDARRRGRGTNDHRDVGVEGVQPGRPALGDPPRRTLPLPRRPRRTSHALSGGAEPARRRGNRSGVDRGRRLARCGAAMFSTATVTDLAELLARPPSGRRLPPSASDVPGVARLSSSCSSATIRRRRSGSEGSSWQRGLASGRPVPATSDSTSPPAQRCSKQSCGGCLEAERFDLTRSLASLALSVRPNSLSGSPHPTSGGGPASWPFRRRRRGFRPSRTPDGVATRLDPRPRTKTVEPTGDRASARRPGSSRAGRIGSPRTPEPARHACSSRTAHRQPLARRSVDRRTGRRRAPRARPRSG